MVSSASTLSTRSQGDALLLLLLDSVASLVGEKKTDMVFGIVWGCTRNGTKMERRFKVRCPRSSLFSSRCKTIFGIDFLGIHVDWFARVYDILSARCLLPLSK